MQGEFISIETLRIYQEIEKENKELQDRINKAIEHIKKYSNCSGSIIEDKFIIEKIDEIYNGTQLLNILTGDEIEKI